MGSEHRRKYSFIKMDAVRWASLAGTLLTLLTLGSSTEPRVVCYYTNWSVYRPGTAKFNPQNINPYLCTHLVYAFGGFTKENELKPFDKYQDIEKGGYAKFNGLKTYNKNLKTMLAIGGWNEGSARFSPMVASRESRKEFVRNTIKFLRQNHFDGLDLDWEYPAFRDGGKPKDRENYAKLVKELREEFEKESQKTGKTRLLLTMAVPAGVQYIEKGYDVKTLNKYLDWMNLLAYDYHSAFEPAVNHHAPLYPLEEPNEYSVDDDLNIDYTVKAYIEAGADRDKIVVGIPTYGRSYTLFNPDAFELGSPADGPGEQGDATREKGYLAYYEICESLLPKKKKKSVDSDEEDEDESDSDEEDAEWTVMQPNPNAMGPVAFKGNQWVGYDDVDIVKKKADYVAENGLGGIMFWSIDNDDFRGTCHGKPYPLIEAAKEVYIAKLGSKKNEVVSEKKRPSSTLNSRRRNNRPRPSSATSTTTTTSKPTSIAKLRSNRRQLVTSAAGTSAAASTTPAWGAATPEPPTTPDPGADFKCTEEGFFQHPRDCKKYFWCLDSGPSNLGIVAHQFTCPSGLFFNKAADSCDFARNVLCKTKTVTTKTTPSTTTTTTTTTTTRRPVKLTSKSASLFRTSTTTTTPEPESEEEYEEEVSDENPTNIDAEDPKVLKDLIDLIKKLGGVDQLEKHLRLGEPLPSTDGSVSTTPSSYNMKLYQVLQRTQKKTTLSDSTGTETPFQYSARGSQRAGLKSSDEENNSRKDRPQYVTINRFRSQSTTQKGLPESEEEDIQSEEDPELNLARAAEPENKVGTTAKQLQYVNIRRARPTLSTSDTADDTASRNALFERIEPIVSVSEQANTLDIAGARRENIPEYVTIRRQRPSTEETTTVKNPSSDDEVLTALEKELSSPSSQPPYSTIVRARSTTISPPEELSSPEPTTVLAVQLSSLLNSPIPTEVESPKPEASALTSEATEPPTTPSMTTPLSTTSTTTTSTVAPTSPSTRRNLLRRRGSTTTTTTTTPAPSPTTQAATERRKPFLRRTKATAPPDVETTKPTTVFSTRKYDRRGNSRFKNRKEPEIARSEPEIENGTASSIASEPTSERPRGFARRRYGAGATVSTTTTPTSTTTTQSTTAASEIAASSTVASTSRRPFRVASRRRLSPRPSTSTTTTEPATPDVYNVEDGGENQDGSPNNKKANRLQKRPLATLKDQNLSATNEEEKKRQSKKYNANIRKNKFSDAIKQKTSQDVVDTTTEVRFATESTRTTVEELNAETAIAIAAHQLLAAPIPAVTIYEEPKTTMRSTTKEYKTTNTGSNMNTGVPGASILLEEFTKLTSATSEYIQTSTGTSPDTTQYSKPSTAPVSTYYTLPDTDIPKTTSFTRGSSPYTSFTSTEITDFTSKSPTTLTESKTSKYYTISDPFTTKSYDFSRADYDSKTSPFSKTYFDFSSPISFSTPSISSSGLTGVSQTLAQPTTRYLTSTDKYDSPQQFGYTSGYTGYNQDPYYTKDYLLESPASKTTDEQYQYLSSVTTQSTTDIPRTTPRKISTTIPPTYETTTLRPRRTRPTVAPFERTTKTEPNRTYRPTKGYDYYDDSAEKFANKYFEGTKVVVHASGSIECLDMGNFPHPTSCKKFIQCARMESGATVGWEYICPKGLSFDPIGGICNWSAGLGCNEKDLEFSSRPRPEEFGI